MMPSGPRPPDGAMHFDVSDLITRNSWATPPQAAIPNGFETPFVAEQDGVKLWQRHDCWRLPPNVKASRRVAGSTTGHLATTTKLAQQRGHPSTRLPPAVRPVPVELSRSQHHGAWLQLAALNSIDRYHLRVIAGREDLVCVHEVGSLQRRF